MLHGSKRVEGQGRGWRSLKHSALVANPLLEALRGSRRHQGSSICASRSAAGQGRTAIVRRLRRRTLPVPSTNPPATRFDVLHPGYPRPAHVELAPRSPRAMKDTLHGNARSEENPGTVPLCDSPCPQRTRGLQMKMGQNLAALVMLDCDWDCCRPSSLGC